MRICVSYTYVVGGLGLLLPLAHLAADVLICVGYAYVVVHTQIGYGLNSDFWLRICVTETQKTTDGQTKQGNLCE